MHLEPPGAYRPPSASRDSLRTVGIAITAIVMVASALVVAVNASGGDSLFPTKWDPRVAPVANKVAKLRGLEFKHPVPVRFLAAKEFEKEVGVDNGTVTAADRVEIEQEAGALRASGLIGGNVDLLKAVDTARRSSTLALYSFRTKEILVRGSKLDAQHRVTLAHELVHVLQDQHFDLEKLQHRAFESKSSDTSVFTGLIEGDAVRIEELYRDGLSKAEKAEYDRVDAAEQSRVGRESTKVPEIVQFVFGAPYAFGPATAIVLAESGGPTAINQALVGPVPTSRMFIRPGDVTAGVPVAEPVIPPGTTPVGSDDAFGGFELYTVLGTQIDALRALHAADAVWGGRQTSFKRGKTVCVRVELAVDRPRADAVVRAALREWAKTRPKAAQAEVFDTVLGYSACDPGKSAPAPARQGFVAMSDILGLRTGLTISAAREHLDGTQARCAARLFMTHPDVVQLMRDLGSRAPTGQQAATIRDTIRQSVTGCRADVDAGLP